MSLPLRPLLISGLVFAVSMAITLTLWTHEQQNFKRSQKANLDFNLREAASRIEQHMASYEQMVRGVNGFLAGGNVLDRSRFRAYVNSLSLGPNFSGVEAVGFSKLVPSQEVKSHVLVQRASGLTRYAIYPEGSRDAYAPVVQVESGNNNESRFYGYDPFANAQRQQTMLRAAESGSSSISRLAWSQPFENRLNKSDYVLFLPLYRGGETPDTPQGRRLAVDGWAFAVLRISDLMASLYGERRTELHLSLHDNVTPSAESLLFESTGDHVRPTGNTLAATEYLDIGGATWVLTVRAQASGSEMAGFDQSSDILSAGTLLTILLAIVCWQMLTAKNYAVALAHTMTGELRKSEELARHMAQHDPLTCLPNRALFSDRIARAISLAKRDKTRLALLYLDLDNFKPINDTYGHAMGDRVLGLVASRLIAAVRESDTVGRIGGDEFVVLLPVIASNDNAQTVGLKILESLREPMVFDGTTVSVSASIGVATFPEHGADEVELFKAADAAMYAAKASRRDCLVWAEG
jgi:diguanylate cyclase (GGDEF)-like protein